MLDLVVWTDYWLAERIGTEEFVYLTTSVIGGSGTIEPGSGLQPVFPIVGLEVTADPN